MFTFIIGNLILLFKAFVLSYLWDWYIVPYDLPEINTFTFFILMYMYSIITVSSETILEVRDLAEDDRTYIMIFNFVATLLAFGFGWLFLQF